MPMWILIQKPITKDPGERIYVYVYNILNRVFEKRTLFFLSVTKFFEYTCYIEL